MSSIPASVVVKPSESCDHCGWMKIKPKIPPATAKLISDIPHTGRKRNVRSATPGVVVPKSSNHTNAASSSTARIVVRTMPASSNQPLRSPSSSTYCSEPRPAASNATPMKSNGRRFGAFGSRTKSSTRAVAAMPGSTFTKNTQRQLRSSVSTPPSVGPIVGPITTASVKSDWLFASCEFG